MSIRVRVLIVALLPSLTYLGHWQQLVPPLASATYLPDQARGQADHSHVDHCHEGPASCAEQPVLANASLRPDGGEVRPPAQPVLPARSARELAHVSFPARPPTPPPRAA
jgi:hypothetical protein